LDQKRTTAPTVNGHNSLMRDEDCTRTTSPQIGVQVPLYSDSGQQCGTLAPAGGQYPLKPLGDTSPAWPCHLSRKAYSTKLCTVRSRRTAYCRPPKCCLTSPSRALNPSQLSKRTNRLWDRYVGQDPRWSRTARGVTALTCRLVYPAIC